MLLAPSEIHFLHDAGSCVLSPDVVDELGQRLEENRGRVPRIQVVEKDGSWFALNDSYLRVYRELERQGRCPRVNVTVVSLNKVPQDLQKGMTVTSSATPSAAVVVGASAEQNRCCANWQLHQQQTGDAVNAVATSPTTATPDATSGPPKTATATGRQRADTQAPRGE
ncbi:hypothetical protein HPB51_015027 [Rhipicephalus microplus]|uniref:Uncharacterized protein n=1 Tax=Rhipicephalus microplus TaxID=6941 RepID=A0A9J6ET37_RHIMP|nr:hypothetical protein HPB51_015027 [Rhipicephalus microplus]